MGVREDHLGSVRRIDGLIYVRRMSSELFQQLAGLDTMHTCQAIVGGAEDMGAVSREGTRSDTLAVRPFVPSQALPCPDLPDLHRPYLNLKNTCGR